MKINNLSHINIIEGREAIRLGANKLTHIITETYSDTHHVQRRGERGINITFIPAICRFHPFNHITTASAYLVSQGKNLST